MMMMKRVLQEKVSHSVRRLSSRSGYLFVRYNYQHKQGRIRFGRQAGRAPANLEKAKSALSSHFSLDPELRFECCPLFSHLFLISLRINHHHCHKHVLRNLLSLSLQHDLSVQAERSFSARVDYPTNHCLFSKTAST